MEWYFPIRDDRFSLPVRNIINIARGTVNSTAHKYFYDEVEGKVVNLLEDGSMACAAVVSRILICVHYGNNIFLASPHATVDSLISDLERCGWQNIDKTERRPGSVVVWVKSNGNRHVGIAISEYAVLSNCKEKKAPVLHAWTTESDDHTPREIEQVFWHPLFDK